MSKVVILQWLVSAPPEHALMVIAASPVRVNQGTLTLSTTGSFLEQMRTRMVVNDFLFYIVICKVFFSFLQFFVQKQKQNMNFDRIWYSVSFFGAIFSMFS